MTMRTTWAGACAAAVLLTGGVLASPAQAAPTVDAAGTAYIDETFPGQYVPNSGKSCGGAMYMTDDVIITPAGKMRAYAWIFRNCGDTTLRRKAIVKLDLDGKCYSIKPRSSRTLSVKYISWALKRNPFERSAAC